MTRQIEKQSLVLRCSQSQLTQSRLLFIFGGEDCDLRLISLLNLERERTTMEACVLLEGGNERWNNTQHRSDFDLFKHRAEWQITYEAKLHVR